MKSVIKLFDLIKPPFKADDHSLYIFDQNGFVCGMVRGWGVLQNYENGGDLQDELHKFISDAMNEKFARMQGGRS
jgi:hypothetical protein